MKTMIKKQDKPIGTVTFKIGTMQRTIDVHVFGWGVSLSVRSKTANGQTIFETRNFWKTTNFRTIESNIKRCLRYFKASNEHIETISAKLA